jgi:hypothetical protein
MEDKLDSYQAVVGHSYVRKPMNFAQFSKGVAA